MCMLFLFMIYYKCIFIRFHEDKYSMDFFKKKNIKKLKIINNKYYICCFAIYKNESNRRKVCFFYAIF